MNLYYQGILDEQSHLVELVFFCECFNYLNIELIIHYCDKNMNTWVY